MDALSRLRLKRFAWANRFTEDPGPRLEPGVHPRLDRLLVEVAERLRTRPLDEVFLTPYAEAAVFERGSVGKRLTHRTRRCLILGIGVLEGMTQGELAAILAHEYGHLVNRDTSRDAADPALEEATLEAMNRKTSARDSHPAPCDRIAWTRPIQRTGGSAIDHARPAWSLFSEREQVELAMTEVLRAFVAGHGIGIRGPGHTGRAKVSWN